MPVSRRNDAEAVDRLPMEPETRHLSWEPGHMSLLASLVPDWESLTPGEFRNVAALTPLHQVVRPVVRMVDNGPPEVAGSAVHLSAEVPTALVTARHVFHGSFTQDKFKGRNVTVYVCWTPEGPELQSVEQVRGRLMQAVHYEEQKTADIATLSLGRLSPGQTVGPTFPVALRMPRRGERVAVIGYPDGAFEHLSGALGNGSELVLNAPLRVSIGQVLDPQPERVEDINFENTRAAPGFYTDPPTPDGMSGGAVLDERGSLIGLLSRSSDYEGHWTSYVASAADMLGLHIRVPAQFDGGQSVEGPVEALLGAGKVSYTVDRKTFKVVAGRPVYSATD
jgi:hypothetical protein